MGPPRSCTRLCLVTRRMTISTFPCSSNRWGGTISRKRLQRGDLPPEFQGRLFTAEWQGFEVDATEIPEQLGEAPTITYNVLIPLKPVAIQVKLIGPADRKAELQSLLEETLAGLQGESSWTEPAARPSAAVSQNERLVLLGIAIALILGGLGCIVVGLPKDPEGNRTDHRGRDLLHRNATLGCSGA